MEVGIDLGNCGIQTRCPKLGVSGFCTWRVVHLILMRFFLMNSLGNPFKKKIHTAFDMKRGIQRN
jgi:hypothetical protein